MKALALTTRFKDDETEGDACLLVYDLPHLSGTTVGDDVRDVLERRPNTPRIYVLAPFLTDDAVASALLDGSALVRAGASDAASSVKVAALGLRFDRGAASVTATEFALVNGSPAAMGLAVLAESLREGWLFNLFDEGRGLVDAPIGVHFSKASGKHASKFLRTSSVLLTSAACAVVAFFGLATVRSFEPRRIFVDTAPLLALAFAMHRVAVVRQLWAEMPTAKSFSSYGGVGNLPRLGRSDLVLISASTSGGLADRLLGLGLADDMLLTLFLLKSAPQMASRGRVLCDLTYRSERGFGYLSALTIADSARSLSDLKIFLSYGELGPDTFTFRSALELMLPWTGEQPSPWDQELKLWQRLSAAGALPPALVARLDWLTRTASSPIDLFLPGYKGAALAISPDFVLLDTKKAITQISQADVYTVVCNALAAARCDNVGIEAKVQRANPSPTWGQTLYAQSILCPSNFRDFNDAVLRAALLRAASMQELNYSMDEASSEEMRDVLLTDIQSWSTGRGDALPEFLIALGTGRLRLTPRHIEQLKQEASGADMPPVFNTLIQEARLLQ